MSGPNRLKITWTFGLCTWSGIHLSVELPPFVTTSKQMTACSLMWVRNFVYSFCSGQNCTGNAFHPRSFLYWFTPEDQLQQPSVVHTLRIFAHNYGIGLVVITTKIKPFINVLYSWKLCLKRKIKPIWIGTQSKFKRQNVRLKDEFKKCSLFYFFFSVQSHLPQYFSSSSRGLLGWKTTSIIQPPCSEWKCSTVTRMLLVSIWTNCLLVPLLFQL